MTDHSIARETARRWWDVDEEEMIGTHEYECNYQRDYVGIMPEDWKSNENLLGHFRNSFWSPLIKQALGRIFFQLQGFFNRCSTHPGERSPHPPIYKSFIGVILPPSLMVFSFCYSYQKYYSLMHFSVVPIKSSICKVVTLFWSSLTFDLLHGNWEPELT